MKKLLFALLVFSLFVCTACSSEDQTPIDDGTNQSGNAENNTQGTENNKKDPPSLLYPAEEGSAGLIYTLGEDGTYTVTGKGSVTGDIVVGNVHDGIPVTAIGENAFFDADITSLRVSAGIRSIGENAFLQCASLASVTLHESVKEIGAYAFANCGALTSFVGNGVENVGIYAFASNGALRSVTVSALSAVERFAFAGCSALESFTFPSSTVKIGTSAFAGCTALHTVTLREGVKTVGDNAFSGCTALTALHFPKSVNYIGVQALAHCDALVSLTVEEGNNVYAASGNCVIQRTVKTVVQGCKTSVIPADGSVTAIGEYAFTGVSLLSAIHIPPAVEKISARGFFGASSLSSITVDSANPVFYAVQNCLIGKADRNLVLGCQTSVIPEEVQRIDAYAFYNASEMTSIFIPASVSYVDALALEGCTSLVDIEVDTRNGALYATGNCLIERASKKLIRATDNSVLPTDGSIEIIGMAAFSRCSITELIIPASVKKIERLAFFGCASLESVVFEEPNGWSNGRPDAPDLTDPAAAATMLRGSAENDWTRTSGAD